MAASACERHDLFDVGEAQFSHREHLSFESSPFLLAVDFDARVLLSALTVAKQVRDACSLLLILTFDRFNGYSVEERIEKISHEQLAFVSCSYTVINNARVVELVDTQVSEACA